jgi:hypothetical protein
MVAADVARGRLETVAASAGRFELQAIFWQLEQLVAGHWRQQGTIGNYREGNWLLGACCT